ncbi:alpha/beta hydrolase [Methylobacterium sp. Leaf104]|uniref:alpha/beta hydrolase n=1 Tax=Methylobacterium TaxID=407 RepID=UPI0006FD38FD|nr:MULTISPECIES: alpha/beta hydrolase [Methylobacterium]KQP30549.1 alpha/beta hydrolase [Methylobacterium sp. Leaf104]MCI9882068.1 alpha/beta hydrolase [Methylobacterium goesingense]
MRLLASLVATAFLGLSLLGVTLLTVFQRHLIYPGAFRSQAPTPARPAPAGTEAISLPTADGERLLGFWRAPEPGCPVILTLHGNGSRPEPGAARFAGAPWRTAGWGVLAIAYRGYPGSTGSPSEAGLIADGQAAYALVQARAPGAPVLLHGHSLGAAVAVALAESRPHLGLYLEAPFDSLSAIVAGRFPYLPTRLLLQDTFRSDSRIAAGTGPVLIVHGADDAVVPRAHAERLAALAGPRAQMTVIAGDHVSILGTQDRQALDVFGSNDPACRPLVPPAVR